MKAMEPRLRDKRGKYRERQLPPLYTVAGEKSERVQRELKGLLKRITRLRRLRSEGRDVDLARLQQLENKYRRHFGIGYQAGVKGYISNLKQRAKDMKKKLARVEAEILFLEYDLDRERQQQHTEERHE